jgi:hypothetical protein
MKCGALTLLAVLSACGGKILTEATDPYARECAGANTPPSDFACTGLYTNVETKEIAAGVRSYAPAVPLWADGADKQRWIFLPAGTKIDASDPNEWTFPVGTKVWKEFSRDGKRVETRLFQKVRSTVWARATYLWNADESAATLASGGDIPWGDGGTYHVPTGDECDMCHRGRTDRILGFEQVSLGLDGASGLTLAQLVAEGLIAPVPARTRLAIGDDGTGVAAVPLAWIHVNCGVSCHNGNSDSTAFGSGQRLRLDPTLLDGRSSADFDARTTTLNVPAHTSTWNGQIRIVPGDPKNSLLVKLISNRATPSQASSQMSQMPPIATLLVDQPHTQDVVTWISNMH